MWWSRYPRWVSTHTYTRTHTHTLTAPHTHMHIHYAEFPAPLFGCQPSWCTRRLDSPWTVHTVHYPVPDCLVFHVCLSRLFGVVVLLVAPAKWSDWASTTYDVIVGAASMHCALNWANPLVYVLMTGECERVKQSCVLLYGFIWFMLKWRFVFIKCLLWIGTEIIGTCTVL